MAGGRGRCAGVEAGGREGVRGAREGGGGGGRRPG